MSSPLEFLKLAFANNSKIDPQKELELVEKYKAGDQLAFRQLQVSLRPLIDKLISEAMPNSNALDASTLRLTVTAKLPDILKKYDANKNTRLSTFVYSQLRGHLGNTVKENVSGPHVPRNQATDLYRYDQAVREAHMEFGKNPPEETIKQFYMQNGGLTPYDSIKQYKVKSFQSDAVFSGGDTEGELLTFQDKFSPGLTIQNDEHIQSMRDDENQQILMRDFDWTEQQVINKVEKEGQTFAQVALSHGLTTAQVKKIMRRWLKVTGEEGIS